MPVVPTELVENARVSLTIAFLVVILQEGIGVTLGALSGFHGGWIDNIVPFHPGR